MKYTKLRMALAITLSALWLGVIWGNSLLSGEESSQVSGLAGRILDAILPFLHLDTEEGRHLLRKLAHFSEFAVLGGLLGWAFRMPGYPLSAPVSWGISAAAADETIQRFVDGRHGCLTDVLIDSAGVLTGAALLYLAACLQQRFRMRRL